MGTRIMTVVLVVFMAVIAWGQQLDAVPDDGPPGPPDGLRFSIPTQVAVEGHLVRATMEIGPVPAASSLTVRPLAPRITSGRIEVDVELEPRWSATADERAGGVIQVTLPTVPPGRYELSMQVTLIEGETRQVLAEIDGIETVVTAIEGPTASATDPMVMLRPTDGEWEVVEADPGAPGPPGAPIWVQLERGD